jgi:serine/threonine protein phosphatase PrpC
MKPEAPNYANQDCHLEIDVSEGKKLLGVFDGHGKVGEHVSNRVKATFAEMAHSIASASDVQGAFQQAFAQARNHVMQTNLGEDSGTTATVALVDSVKKTVSIAHVGDSTATVIDSYGNIVFQSVDHRPDNEKEAQRLRACGSQIRNGRLHSNSQPELHVGFSRGIGDFTFTQQGVIAEPDIVTVPFDTNFSLLLASDGVWDVLPKETVARMAAQSPDSASNIVTTARSTWMQMPHSHIDDITAVVLKCKGTSPTQSLQRPASQLGCVGSQKLLAPGSQKDLSYFEYSNGGMSPGQFSYGRVLGA